MLGRGSGLFTKAYRRPTDRVQAFSLIEMLVVISIIALLLAILFPSLRSARAQSRKVVCSSNVAAIGRAAAAYGADCEGWLCGSPGTSGSVMYYRTPSPEPEDVDFDTDPVQIWDYAGVLAGTYMNMSLPADRAERFEALVEGVFSCPSNRFKADPVRGRNGSDACGSFKRLPMVSYNTFRNFLMWPRTMVNRNPAKPWGDKAPHPEASFDHLDGRTLQPRHYMPHFARITNPAGKVYLADGNRFTTDEGRITYHVAWNAEDGGAFCNGGPTLREYDAGYFVLSAYHFDRRLGSYAYRHWSKGERGITAFYFDGHADFITERQSRQPDRWWPRGTIIPFPEFNEMSLQHLIGRFDRDFNYVVGR